MCACACVCIGLEVAVILRPFWPKRHVSAPLPLAALAPWRPTRFDMGHSTGKKNTRSGKSGFAAWNNKHKAPKPTNIKQRQTSRTLGPPWSAIIKLRAPWSTTVESLAGLRTNPSRNPLLWTTGLEV